MNDEKNQAGFTLIEVMIVIAIIGILAAIALPRFHNANEKARDAEAELALRAIAVAAEVYYVENGVYPGELADLFHNPDNGNIGILGDSIPNRGIRTLRPIPLNGYTILYRRNEADQKDTTYEYIKDAKGKVTIKKDKKIIKES